MPILNGRDEDVTSKDRYDRDDAVTEVLHKLWDENAITPRIRTEAEIHEEIEKALATAASRGQRVCSLGVSGYEYSGGVAKFVLCNLQNYRYSPPTRVDFIPGDVVEVYTPEEVKAMHGLDYNESYRLWLKKHNYEFTLWKVIPYGFEISLFTATKQLSVDNYQIKRLIERRRDFKI